MADSEEAKTRAKIFSLEGRKRYLVRNLPDYEQRIKDKRYNDCVAELDFLTRFLILLLT